MAAHEAEEESDTIAEDFLEGKTEIDDFLSSFMEKRTVCNIQFILTGETENTSWLKLRQSLSGSVVQNSALVSSNRRKISPYVAEVYLEYNLHSEGTSF